MACWLLVGCCVCRRRLNGRGLFGAEMLRLVGSRSRSYVQWQVVLFDLQLPWDDDNVILR